VPEENRVFDVTKPKHVSPAPTSKPVIVGHQPMVSDPMVKDRQGADDSERLLNHSSTKINVSDEPDQEDPKTTLDEPELKTGHEEDTKEPATRHESVVVPDHTDENKPQDEPVSGPAKFDEPLADAENDTALPADEPTAETAPSENTQTAEPAQELTDEMRTEEKADTEPVSDADQNPGIQPHEETPAAEQPHHPEHIQGLHFAEPKRTGRNLKWIVTGLVVLIVAIYLLLDSGLISTGIKLPFHVFKQDNAAPQAQTDNSSAQQPAAQPSSSLPTGYKLYNLSGTPLTFAAPATWGDPTSQTEQGYAKRGGTNQPSGTYSYLVTFATNKDIQLAVTSNQYLPPARDRQYYDYLQWCTGTNDGKFYQSILNFTTDPSKIDTPSTISCDQGPLANATKVDNDTLLVAKAADAGGHTIGDIYIKNLSDKNLPVLRVKDAAMTNGADIKNLLGTVKLAASS